MELDKLGFSLVPNLLSSVSINAIIKCIDQQDEKDPSFLRSKDLFAIRELFLRIPALLDLILTNELKELLSVLGLSERSITKAIYFDKPASSNWFVAFHQDLIINVERHTEIAGYSNWTNKRGLIGVQPPLEILQNTTTLRIHLDDADESNGALRVLPHSQLNGIKRTDRPFDTKDEVCCTVKKRWRYVDETAYYARFAKSNFRQKKKGDPY